MSFLAALTLIMVASLLLPFASVVRGPTVYDRMLGASVLGTKTVVIICLVGFVFQRQDMFVDIAVAYAMLNFIGGIVVAKYLDRTEGTPR